MRARFVLHCILWLALFAVFIWIGFPIFGSAIKENRLAPSETNSSIDAYLGPLTGLEHGSEQLPENFQELGKNGSLIIFVRDGNSQSEFLGMLVGYLSWPREVQLIDVPGPTVDKELAEIKPGRVAGVVFCSVDPPPWLQDRISLAWNITLVPVTQAAP